jgi:thiol reductant ABC exporter CydD subunit
VTFRPNRTGASGASPGSRPYDPRLLHLARAARTYLVVAVAVGGLTALLVVAQAWLLATTVAGAFIHGKNLGQLRGPVVLLLVVIVARAGLGWASELAANRASASTKSDLRNALVDRIALLGPAGLDRDRTGGLATLATKGVDALDSYFARYLPQLFLAVIVPLTVVVVVAGNDWISAIIIAVTVPLIPVFMILVGASTRQRTELQFRTLQRLAGHFLDVVAGLPTLKVFGRSKAQVAAIRESSDRYRETTMSTLRVAFVSSLILELLATLSVALVAVAIGLRLLRGHLEFQTALFVLVLAPEAYLPLRLLGTNFHASAEGIKASEQVFEVLERPLPPRGSRLDLPGKPLSALSVEALAVTYPGRRVPALQEVSFTVEPGEVLALAGPSGCGKSTLLGVLLGLVRPTAGSVRIGGVGLEEFEPDAWRSLLAWVPQRPHLFATSIAANVRIGRPDATDEQVRRALRDAGVEEVVDRLPEGLATRLGEGGAGLSAGERQRLALARAFVRDAPLVLLDEPTANLDAQTEEAVLQSVRLLMKGRTVVMVAHRPALIAGADRVVRLTPGRVAP